MTPGREVLTFLRFTAGQVSLDRTLRGCSEGVLSGSFGVGAFEKVHGSFGDVSRV